MDKLIGLVKNKKILIMYLLGVLIVSSGISFAYFATATNNRGSGETSATTLASVATAIVESRTNVAFDNDSIYPGHTDIASMEVIGLGENEPLYYNVYYEGTSTFTTPISYKLYKTEEKVEASYNCTKKTSIKNGAQILSEECTGANIDKLGSVIKSGTITKSEERTKQTLMTEELSITSTEGESVHYYIVLEYPNLDKSQNDDLSSSIVGELNIEESGKEYEKPTVAYTATTSEGNGDWYKSVNIGGTITGSGTSYTGLYCISNTACTPNQTLTISNKTFNVSISNSTSAQMLCTKVVDNNNQSVTSCSNAYKVDGELPTTTIAVNTSTVGENGWYKALSLKINGTDSYSEVETIKYCTTTSSSCTPTTSVTGSSTIVELGTNAEAQAVCALAIDTAGNTSETKCSGAYKVDKEAPTSNSIKINSGDSVTTSTSVTLTLASSGATKMCISNTTSCTSWEDYATSKSWALTNDLGTKTVYVTYKDEAGNTTKVSDTISLREIISDVPSQNGYLTYSGSEQTPIWNNYDSTKLIIGGTTSETNAGTYTATFKPAANYQWSDGTQTTKSVTWTIRKKLEIITQPSSSIVVNGAKFRASVVASGDGLTYQWYYKSVNNTDFIASSVTTASYASTMSSGRDGRQFYVIVTDQYGNSVQSETVTVTVVSITSQPTNQTVTVGDTATFKIATSSTAGITYQWQYRTSSSGEWIDTNVKIATYTETATLSHEGYQYRCVISDQAGNELVSNAATLTVSKITVSDIPSQNGTLTYTGSEQTPSWNNYDKTKLTIGGVTSGTNAGTYTATFTPTENYKWSDGSTSAKSVTWSIGKKEISAVPSQSGTLTYTGSAQSPKWSNYDSSQLTIGGETSKTDAGTYTATFTPTSNYEWSDGSTSAKSVNWTIGKKAGSVTLSATSGEVTYPTEATFTVKTNTSGGTLSVTSSNEDIATVSISDTTVTITPGSNAGTTTITVTSAANTNYKEASATYTVTVKNGTLNVSASNYSGTYDGKAHGISVSSTTSGATITYATTSTGTYSSTKPTYTDAGTYTTYYKVEKAGYTTVSGSKTVTINKATISTVPSQSGTLTYTGSAQSPSWSNYDSTKLTLGGVTSKTDAGTYAATFTPKTNYTWSDGTTTAKSVNWTIGKKAGSVVLSATSGTVTYPTTTSFTVKTNTSGGTLSVTSTNEDIATVSISDSTITITPLAKEGTSTITVTSAANTNYKEASATYTLTNKAAELKITTQPTNVTVAEGETAKTSVVVSGVGLTYQWYYKNAGGTKFIYTDSFKSNTYKVEMTDARAGRQIYCVITDAYGQSVTTNTVTLTNSSLGDKVTASDYIGDYDGSAHGITVTSSLSGATITYATTSTGTYSSTNPTYTDAGTYTIYYKVEKAGYTTVSGSKTVTINKVKISTVPSQSGTLTYTGSAQSPSWNNYDSTKLTLGGVTSKTDSGTYAATFTPKSNYTWSDGTTTAKSVNWTIGKKAGSVVLSATSGTVTYPTAATFTVKTNTSGGTLSVTSTNEDIATVSISDSTITISPLAKAGTSTITVTSAANTNYKEASATYTLTNKAAELKITTQPTNVTVAEGETAKTSVVASGVGLTYQWYFKNAGGSSFEPSSTTISSYDVSMNNTRAGRQIYCVITDAYGQSVTTNTVTLTNSSLGDKVTASAYTGDYDGSAHGITVTSSLSGATITYATTSTGTYSSTNPTYTDAGTYTTYYKVEKTGYTTVSGSKTVTINKVKISTVPSQSGTLTYTGSAQSPSWNNYDSTKLTLGGVTSKTDAGTYTATFTPTTNYTWSDGTTTAKSVNWTIGKKAGSVVLSATSGEVTYPTEATFTVKTNTSGGTLSVTSTNEDIATVSISDSTITITPLAKEGTATITVTSAANTNYKEASATYTLTNKAAELKITTQPTNVTVAEGETAKTTIAVSGVGLTYKWYFKNASSTKFTLTDSFTSNSYSVEMNNTRAGRQIYCVITDAYGQSVTTNTVTLTNSSLGDKVTASDYTGTYDGSAHGITVTSSLSGVTITYATSSTGTYSSTNPTYTDAGTYTIYYKVEKAGYTTVSGSKTVTINKVIISTVPSQSGTLTYTGSSQAPSWNNYDTSKLTMSGDATGTNAGSYAVKFTPKDNYQWSDGTTTAKSVNWTIGKASSSISLTATSLTIDRGAIATIPVTTVGDGTFSAESTDTNVATTSVSGTTLTVTGKTAGSVTITLKLAATTNYAAASKTIDVTILEGAKEATLDNMSTITTRTDFNSIYRKTTTGTIFTAEDDDGTSYYFAGNPTDNWLKFGGFYWRIVRINGDGSIRLIYNGTSTATSGDTTQIGTSAFNTSADDNAYGGYMYTLNSAHGLGTSSTIKGVLETWYTNNLSNYASYIDTNAGFCGDRIGYTDDTGTTLSEGTGTITTRYAAKIRLMPNNSAPTADSPAVPTFKCNDINDLYTLSSASKGNKALSKPIGLITADELAYSGGVASWESEHYLYTGSAYWTMSPFHYGTGSSIRVFTMGSSGFGSNYVTAEQGVRPVINLRSDAKLSGEGTTTNPYTIASDLTGNYVTASGYTGTYDGKSHGITVTSSLSGATITYATSSTGTYSSTNPTYTAAGTYTTYYKVVKSGYATVTGSETITINKATISTVPSQSGTLTYTGSSQAPSWSNYSTSQLTLSGDSIGTNAGTYTAKFTPTANYTWSDGTTTAKSVTWKIAKASGSLSVSPTTLTVNKGGTGSITVTRSGDGKITATSSDTDVATVSVSGTTITVTGVDGGSATITIKVAAGTNHTAPSNKTVSITVDDSTKASILANMTTITTRTDPKTNYTAATTGIIFTAEDDDGISYYFAGAPTDNWVKFAGFYWRIIRINGDGTIRLIYNGTTTAATAEGTRIGTSRFNNNIGFHSVGFMWKSNTLHGLTNNSGVKASLDAWYVDNLSNYASYIDNDAGFCGDRTVEVDENNNYDYGPGIRKWSTDEYTLKCPDSSDLYTLSGSTKGNKALTYPIGLITSDEVAYAGGSGANGTNTSYYLYTGNYYWTISPSSYYNDNAFVFCVHADYGTLHSSSDVSIYKDVRPVINLRADVTLSGSGTSGDPYTVS